MQFKIENRGQIANSGIGKYLQGLDYEKPWMVEIKPWTEKRRTKQNNLSFIWYKERAEFFYNTPDYEHRYCKFHFGCPILCAENDEFLSFYESVMILPEYEEQIEAMKYIDVTSLMTVKQFAEYLNTIERESAHEGCILSRPDDAYWEAMGVKK